MASFISALLMILIAVVAYFGDKTYSLVDKVNYRSTDNTRKIDINGIKIIQHDLRFIKIEDDVQKIEADVDELTQ